MYNKTDRKANSFLTIRLFEKGYCTFGVFITEQKKFQDGNNVTGKQKVQYTGSEKYPLRKMNDPLVS